MDQETDTGALMPWMLSSRVTSLLLILSKSLWQCWCWCGRTVDAMTWGAAKPQQFLHYIVDPAVWTAVHLRTSNQVSKYVTPPLAGGRQLLNAVPCSSCRRSTLHCLPPETWMATSCPGALSGLRLLVFRELCSIPDWSLWRMVPYHHCCTDVGRGLSWSTLQPCCDNCLNTVSCALGIIDIVCLLSTQRVVCLINIPCWYS